ncbi:unnamed protein product [Closterium sp. NIES-64]|nr:unnamed protein product [Closterium sp. NIES-64]
MCKSSRSNYGRKSSAELPHILLVDRGGCYFTEKVWNAELAGASAVLIADDQNENLITMDSPDDDPEAKQAGDLISNITIPSALIQKSTASAIKSALKKKQMVVAALDWQESLPHPDARVEYEFWTNSNDECGTKCDMQAKFLEEFRGYAIILEQQGFTLFTPHYMTWFCPETLKETRQCKFQCVNNGRYCSPDPEGDFDKGYDGRQVVIENLRQLCVWRVANETGAPWVWWEYAADFKKRCRMEEKQYNQECGEKLMTGLGVDPQKVRACMGEPNRNAANPVMEEEQEAQVGKRGRSDVTMLPTIVINNVQYRGKLEAKAVLKAICAGFEESTEPPICLGAEVQTNECLTNNGGCWKGHNLTACKDTFRGRVCECPKDPATGVYLTGDGYTKCEAAGVGRCLVGNGGCWQSTHEGKTYTACHDSSTSPTTTCVCPPGFTGNGHHCKDINECAPSHPACKCPECKCRNTFGSYECSCVGEDMVYIDQLQACISRVSEGSAPTRTIWGGVVAIVLGFIAVFAVLGYLMYQYHLREPNLLSATTSASTSAATSSAAAAAAAAVAVSHEFPGARMAFTSDLHFVPELPESPVPCFRVLDHEGGLVEGAEEPELSQSEAERMYEAMVELQAMDSVFYEAQRQGRFSFYMTTAGEEAVNIASAAAIHAHDHVFAQYREPGVLLWRGFSLADFANQCMGNQLDAGKGRQMPVHYGSAELRFHTISSPLATQIPHAVGAAYGLKMEGEGCCSVAYFGEGAASEGDFHAALNFAAVLEAPVLFICRNNGWAISTPAKEQYRGDGIAGRGAAYGVSSVRVDGNDVLAVLRVVKEARARVVETGKPILVEAMTYRTGHHSTSDDSSRYRGAGEMAHWRTQRDPVTRFRRWLERRGWWDEEREKAARDTARDEVIAALEAAEKLPKPPLSDLVSDVYDVIPLHLQEQERAVRAAVMGNPQAYPGDVPL